MFKDRKAKEISNAFLVQSNAEKALFESLSVVFGGSGAVPFCNLLSRVPVFGK
jgi:hypothetical protein